MRHRTLAVTLCSKQKSSPIRRMMRDPREDIANQAQERNLGSAVAPFAHICQADRPNNQAGARSQAIDPYSGSDGLVIWPIGLAYMTQLATNGGFEPAERL